VLVAAKLLLKKGVGLGARPCSSLNPVFGHVLPLVRPSGSLEYHSFYAIVRKSGLLISLARNLHFQRGAKTYIQNADRRWREAVFGQNKEGLGFREFLIRRTQPCPWRMAAAV